MTIVSESRVLNVLANTLCNENSFLWDFESVDGWVNKMKMKRSFIANNSGTIARFCFSL